MKFEICVILCGGKSSRMGKDKTLLPFKEFPTLTHYQFDKFSKIFENVFVSSKFQKFEPNLPFIKDIFEDYSPMGALHSVFSNFKNQNIFIIPADMPFIKFQTVEKLFDELLDYEVCIAKDSEYTHSLCGFFSSNLANQTKEFYEKDMHKISNLFDVAKFKSVEFEDKEQFFNINYPKDYEKSIKL